MTFLAIIAAAFIWLVPATSAQAQPNNGCAATYNALIADFREAQRPHVEWVAFLSKYPAYPVPVDVESAARQREIVGLYDWRMWSTYWVAVNHDQALAAHLIADFEHHRQIHLANARVQTYSGSAFHVWAADNYLTRIERIKTLLAVC